MTSRSPLATLAAIFVATQADVVHAELPEREAGSLPALPTVSVGIAFVGHSSRLAGVEESGMGGSFEAALGHQRWQAFAEAGISRVAIGPSEQRTDGARLNMALGVRWLARSSPLDETSGIEMLLEAFSGVQQFRWDAGGRLSRPEVGLGVGWQVRHFSRPAISARMGLRAVFAPTDRQDAVAICRGGCTPPASTSSAGFVVSLGVAW